MLDTNEYQSIFNDTFLQVQKVKLGDVNYKILCKELMLKQLLADLEQSEVSYLNDNNKLMANYCEGKRVAYTSAMEILQDLHKSINNL